MDLEKAILRSTQGKLNAKAPYTKYYCPLCRVERKFRYKSNLSLMNYLQVLLLSACIGYLLFPIMKAKVVFMLFIVWMTFETINKILFRKEIPCPECGFDATWYRKDVKVARQKVQDFWKQVELNKKTESLKKEAKIELGNIAPLGKFDSTESTQQL